MRVVAYLFVEILQRINASLVSEISNIQGHTCPSIALITSRGQEAYLFISVEQKDTTSWSLWTALKSSENFNPRRRRTVAISNNNPNKISSPNGTSGNWATYHVAGSPWAEFNVETRWPVATCSQRRTLSPHSYAQHSICHILAF